MKEKKLNLGTDLAILKSATTGQHRGQESKKKLTQNPVSPESVYFIIWLAKEKSKKKRNVFPEVICEVVSLITLQRRINLPLWG